MTRSLQADLRNAILSDILKGTYEVGQKLPAEQELVAQCGVSRVTVRNALRQLREDGVLESTRGRGTLLATERGGVRGDLAMVGLIAESAESFFGSFMTAFDKAAAAGGSLALFKHDRDGVALNDSGLFEALLLRGINNLVIWPSVAAPDLGLLRRVRIVGANLVFFDHCIETPFADVVCLDNMHAIAALYAELLSRSSAPVAFAGVGDGALPSDRERLESFRRVNPEGEVLLLPRTATEPDVARGVQRLARRNRSDLSLICSHGALGQMVSTVTGEMGSSWLVGTVDAPAQTVPSLACAVAQPIEQMAELAYTRLKAQSEGGADWKAGRYAVRGRLVRYGK